MMDLGVHPGMVGDDMFGVNMCTQGFHYSARMIRMESR